MTIMPFNKKIIATLGLLSVVVFGAFTSMTPPAPKDEGFTNLKVLPKNISKDKLHDVMEEWAHSLGVHCNFCHVRNEETKKMDWANDTKPEKEMAREMFRMTNKINQKYFKAKKDSLGMMMHTGVNCNTCHRGTEHPEITIPEGKGPGPMAPPAGQPVPGGAAPDKKQ